MRGQHLGKRILFLIQLQTMIKRLGHDETRTLITEILEEYISLIELLDEIENSYDFDRPPPLRLVRVEEICLE